MIRIQDRPEPEHEKDKRQQLITGMRNTFLHLKTYYDQQKQANKEVDLVDAGLAVGERQQLALARKTIVDLDALIAKAVEDMKSQKDGVKKATETQKKQLEAQRKEAEKAVVALEKKSRENLKNVVFGSEIVEGWAPKNPLEPGVVDKVSQEWLNRYNALLTPYAGALKTWHHDFSEKILAWLSPELQPKVPVDAIFAALQRLYQGRCITVGEFHSGQHTDPEALQEALQKDDKLVFSQSFPYACSDQQIETARTSDQALANVPADYFRQAARLYEAQMQYFAATWTRELRGLAYLSGPPGDVNRNDAFGWVRDRMKQRIAAQTSLGITDQDIREFASDGGRAPYTAFFVLGWQVLREVLGDALEMEVTQSTRMLIGYVSAHFEGSIYASKPLKKTLIEMHHGKCAFCESKLHHISHGDVEHFRPKAAIDETAGKKNKNGYFWEAYEWSNLYISCQICNQIYKKNWFPVFVNNQYEEVRSTADHSSTSSGERPMLIATRFEEPRDHIRFNPITGKAYAYDLAKAFYDFCNQHYGEPLRAPDVFWDLPERIENYDQSRYAVFTQQAATQWHRRGMANLEYLGLNRDLLVVARVQHLQRLRGLFLTAMSGGGLTQASKFANAALVAACKPSAEFSSLAMDALETWKREYQRSSAQVIPLASSAPLELGADRWLQQYADILAKAVEIQVTGQDEESGSKKNHDSLLMYFIPQKDITQRRLAYLAQSAELEDHAEYGNGWFLEIPEEDLDLDVVITKPPKGKKKGANTEEWTTIRELMGRSGQSLSPMFKNAVSVEAKPTRNRAPSAFAFQWK